MRKRTSGLWGVIAILLLSLTGNAQTYDQTAPYQPITTSNQSFTFTFTGLPTSGLAFANARVYVYYFGDFGDYTEWIYVEDPWGDTIGHAGPYANGTDCSIEDTALLTFPAQLLTTMGGTVALDLAITTAVDPSCTSPQIGVRLVFDYCSQGTQSDIASILTMAGEVCPGNGAVALLATPPGGTWTGTGVQGNFFVANTLPAGHYNVHYATSSNGCDSYDDINFNVKVHPEATSLTMVCGPHIDTLVATSQSPYLNWYSDATLSTLVATGDTFITPMITGDTTFYAAFDAPLFIDSFTSMTGNNVTVITDMQTYSGDDRGGIAVTPNYIYIVGDNGTARYDHALSNGVQLPGMGGIFSDLATGQLFTLYDMNGAQAVPVFGMSGTYTANAIRTLNDDLSLGSQTIPLETPITLNSGFSTLMVAGFGKLGVISNQHSYIVDLVWGGVEDLGSGFDINNVFPAESWASYGVLEFDGTNYHAVYRSFSGGEAIVRSQLPAGTESIAFPFNSLSDMTNFTYSVTDDRWYFHWEGANQFGGYDENLAFADASVDTSSTNALSCATPVHLRGFPRVNLGNDTTVCNGGQGIVLNAGSGFDTYIWNGNSGTSTYQADSTQDYIVVVTDSIGCTATDTIHVIIDCTNVKGIANNNGITIYPNPNSGNFTLQLEGWNGKVNIVMTDLAGRAVLGQTIIATRNDRTPVSAGNLAGGIYILRLSGGGKQAVYKIEVLK